MNFELVAESTLRNAALSGVWVLVVVALRSVTLRVLRVRSGESRESMRRWIVLTRNLSVILLLFGLVVIWAEELRTVALSLVAVAAALVLATKELLLCVFGGFYRTATRAFQLGDRIEVGAWRGDVVDETLLSTKLLEVGPGATSHQYTGRALSLPNSVFLLQPIINESFTDDFVLHVLTIPVAVDSDWLLHERRLLEAANEEVAGYLKDAVRSLYRQSDQRGLARPSVEPRVVMQVVKPGEMNLQLRFPAPTRGKGRVEQQVLRGYLARMNPARAGEEIDTGGVEI